MSIQPPIGQNMFRGHTISLLSMMVPFSTMEPPGIDEPIHLSFVISNISENTINFSDSWLEGDRLTWHISPPSELNPQQSHTFSLAFQPISCSTEEEINSTLHIPEQNFSISIDVHCPPPLRMVLIGDDGFTLHSDDYGENFTQTPIESDLPTPLRAQSLVWGNGIFLRAFARGTNPDALGLYQYSFDGVTWNSSQSEPDYAPSDCTYGLGRFVCVRADSLSWSIDGREVTHEPALGDFRLNQILFHNDAFVAVGRGARRVRSEDAQTWNRETFGVDPDTYHSLVQSPDIMVAAGGINRYFISYSTDDGNTWEDVPYGGCQGNYIQSLVYHNGLFLAQGASSCHHNMHRSIDGISWEPIVELQPFDRFILLGALNGYFIAHATDDQGTYIFRSNDGHTWSKRYTLATPNNIRLMTSEEWKP
jgi:hypothetical protein